MVWFGVVLVVAVLVGRLRGGRVTALSEIQVTAWWLLVLGFLVQAAAGFVPTDRDWSEEAGVLLLLGSYAALLIGVWLNREKPGMWIAGIGLLMNVTVIALNQGMPVLAEAVELAGGGSDFVLGAKHVLLDGATRLPFLADIIPLPGTVISMGDVFLAIGLGAFVEDQMHQPLRLFRHRITSEPGSAAGR